jgi:branched-chain amino acid transport system substrate-binding protein
LLKKGAALTAAGAAAASYLTSPALAYKRALAPRPLRVGFWGSFSGFLALNGLSMRRGWDFYLQEHNGRIGGRRVAVVYEDDGSNVALAVQKVKKMVEQDKVDILVGGTNAATGPPVFEYSNSVGVPWLAIVTADDLTQRLAENRTYFIRIGESSSQSAHVLAEWIRRRRPQYRNISFIGSDFLFGHEQIGGFLNVFQRLGGHGIQRIWVPSGAPDMSPFISRIDTQADAVYAMFAGTDAIRFLTQFAAFGLRGRLPLIGNYTLSDEIVLSASGMTEQAVIGIISSGRFSPVSRFSRAWSARYLRAKREVPTNGPADGYTFAQAIEAALKRRNGDITNRRKFAQAFVGLKLDTPRGPIVISPERNSIENVYIREVRRVPSPPFAGYNIPWQNAVVQTYTGVSQFWKFTKAGYLARPPYSRDFPPLR